MARNGNLSSRSVLEHAERQWPSNPYLHMLSTPLRRCIVSHFVLPKAFMIQIKPVHLPSSEEHPPEITMAPDGILHPRFAMRKPGIGAWVTADQTVFKDLYKRQ
ncbi:hypothetical protein Malapachy_0415 [Malassezia pachydermatis]|uniref:Uncharacterized protein n=1 Tax=Malassezia pachydermatis TaxID=77020 RepID=A0A0M8MLN3_9BASI|nr:hypothetical protein Malapachy_0415 [Malassezia pachydermatis]KOS12607.1 hypothetical protein Malapachy_0415 [Malassezia pachydermatis]